MTDTPRVPFSAQAPRPPTLPSEGETRTDTDHLRALVILHYVNAGLSLVGLGFVALHYAIMTAVMKRPELMKQDKDAAAFMEMMSIFLWLYLAAAIFVMAYGILNLLAARFIKARRNRMFTMVVSGLNCLNMPLGTALGVFTLVVLGRDSVRLSYELKASPEKG